MPVTRAKYFHFNKTIMKTNLISLVSTLLLIFCMSFWACEDTIAELQPDTPEQVDPEVELKVSPKVKLPDLSNERQGGLKPFFYTIEKISCTQQGFTLKVNIYKPYNYAYSWIIDELPAGNTNQLHCITGQKVYLTVTRYSDMATVSQYLELPPSAPPHGVADNEAAN